MTDAQALSAYVETASGPAFAVLAARYLDMVYSAALRQTRDPHLAEDAAQAVFIVLARKAATIHDPAALPGWLIRTARYAAMNALTLRARRRRHEQKAAAMAPQMTSDDASDGPALTDALDRQLSRLGET